MNVGEEMVTVLNICLFIVNFDYVFCFSSQLWTLWPPRGRVAMSLYIFES